jgi:hypothetical protein
MQVPAIWPDCISVAVSAVLLMNSVWLEQRSTNWGTKNCYREARRLCSGTVFRTVRQIQVKWCRLSLHIHISCHRWLPCSVFKLNTQHVSGRLRRNSYKSIRKLFSVVYFLEHKKVAVRKFISQLGMAVNSVGRPWCMWEGDIGMDQSLMTRCSIQSSGDHLWTENWEFVVHDSRQFLARLIWCQLLSEDQHHGTS